MQAIETKWHGPTDSNGSRITARCDAKRITVPYDHALDVAANHAAAARVLATRLGWSGRWVGGSTRDGYAFVCGGRGESFTVKAGV
jgi:hypothetical protein